MILRFLNIQGIAGLVAGLALGILLIIQKGETRHWRKQSSGFEQLYRAEQAAFAGSVANYRAAADQALAADRANAERVRANQSAINEGSNHAFETRLADARARARRLRDEAATPAADPGIRAGAAMPGLSVAPGGTAQATGENGLSAPDALTATEQAIQLDELIKWVRRQHEVDNQGVDAATSH